MIYRVNRTMPTTKLFKKFIVICLSNYTAIFIRYGANYGSPGSAVNTFLHFSSLSLSHFGPFRATVRKRQRHSFRVRILPLAKVSRARTLKPPKATPKTPQSHPHATLKPPQSQLKANSSGYPRTRVTWKPRVFSGVLALMTGADRPLRTERRRAAKDSIGQWCFATCI